MSRLVHTEYADGPALVTRSGLSEDEHTELESLADEAHAAFCQGMVETISRLRALLAQGDPLHTLAIIQTSNLTSSWGAYYEPTHPGLESKVELVAGLLLTQSPFVDGTRASSKIMQAIHDELDRLAQLSLLRNLTAPKEDDGVVAALRAGCVTNWMTVRGASYAHHGKDLATELFRPFDHWSLKRYGFTINDTLDVGTAVQALMVERRNSLVTSAQDFAQQVQRCTSSQAAHDNLPAERSTQLGLHETQILLAQRAFIEVFEHGIRDAMSFTPADLAGAGLPQDRIQAVLTELSLSAGDLEPRDYDGPFDKTPLIEHPFFEFDGRYVLAVPGMILRDAVPLLEDRFMDGISRFSRARAKTLDHLAVDYLKAPLPGSRGFTNLHYEGTELDGLVIFERTALVVEGKGSALSVQARRGDVVRLGRDLSRTVEEAWIQGARARDYLLCEEDTVFTDESGLEILRIPAGSVDEVFIVNPTLHELGGHGPQLPRLRSLGLFPAGEFPWSIFINDLRVISETAGNAAVLLHYLAWRARLPLGDRVIVEDELDLWSSYLQCERFGALAHGSQQFVGNSTTDFDAYYAGIVGDGPKRPKPEKFLREPVKRFVERMASERPPGWRDAADACLDLSIPELAFVGAYARRAWKKANATREPDVTDCGRVRLIGVPREYRLTEIIAETEQVESESTFHLYVSDSKTKRGEIIWAKRVRPLSFELSDFEKVALRAVSRAEDGVGAP